ncbi:MAG TPA: RsmE family RNA methyltransferase [Bryobacteraceae bacterium]|nr:RsmE family RNA methyltransferase [Bryobacteraceae bacterium]
MARRRFFVDRIHGDRAELTGDDARHLARVLRAEVGQQYELSDNQRAFLAEISEVGAQRVTFRVVEPLPPEPPSPEITIFAALIKFDRFEWLVEKATELGVASIVPVDADRTEEGLARAAVKRVDRWKKIARESSQQSRRLRIPEIAAPITFDAAICDSTATRFFLEERPGADPLLRILAAARTPGGAIAILTGPEGGWTGRERDLGARAGWKPVSISRQVLRSETAAIAALAILGHFWNILP